MYVCIYLYKYFAVSFFCFNSSNFLPLIQSCIDLLAPNEIERKTFYCSCFYELVLLRQDNGNFITADLIYF